MYLEGIKALSLNYDPSNSAVPLYRIDFQHLCRVHVRMAVGLIEDGRIMGFYGSSETAWKNMVYSSEICAA